MKYLNTFSRAVVVFLIIAFCTIVFFGNSVSADKPYMQDLNSDPADSRLRFEYALKLLKEGQYGQAQKQLVVAYEFDKKNVYIGSALSRLLINSEDIRTEIERTLQTVANRPDYVAAWVRLASLYESIGDIDRAEQARLMGENLKTI